MEDYGLQESKHNFIPCIRWVKQGVAKSNPEKVQLTKEELAQIITATKSKLRVAENEEADGSDVEMAESNGAGNGDEFNMEKYDDEDADEDNPLGIGSLAELPDAEENFDDSDDSEKEDDIIKKEDNLVLAGRVDGDASILEVYIHNESEGSLYVHHDFILPAFPLCIEWLDHEPGHNAGNYCAIGSMNPIIDVWDLDIVNCLEPAYTLGQPAKRKKNQQAIGHTDAVLALAWNTNLHHILASGSADTTVMIWDLDLGKPSVTIKSFTKQVQCLEWHKLEAQNLLAGGCDKSARVFDCTNPETHLTWPLKGEAEKLVWNPWLNGGQPFTFYAGTSEGMLQCFDIRKGELWSTRAHTEEVTGLVLSTQCPGLLITTSPDGSLKIWDAKDNQVPVMVYEKDFKMGKVLSMDNCPDSPFIIAAGGDSKSNNFTVLDLMNIDVVKHTFESRRTEVVIKEER